MIIKYDIDVQKEAVLNSFNRTTNQIFKLLPTREEGLDWKAPLKNLIIELGGMGELLNDHIYLFPLLCKLEGLLKLDGEDDFPQFRKTVFECLSLITEIKKCLG